MNKSDELERLERLQDRYKKKQYDAGKEWRDKANAVEDEIIALLTDIKNGDIISWKHGKGRRRGIVESVTRPYGACVGFWVKTIKANGDEGRRTEVYHWSDVKKEDG